MLPFTRCGRLNKRDQNNFNDQYSDTCACHCWQQGNHQDPSLLPVKMPCVRRSTSPAFSLTYTRSPLLPTDAFELLSFEAG